MPFYWLCHEAALLFSYQHGIILVILALGQQLLYLFRKKKNNNNIKLFIELLIIYSVRMKMIFFSFRLPSASSINKISLSITKSSTDLGKCFPWFLR